jgi:hypothetical protein
LSSRGILAKLPLTRRYYIWEYFMPKIKGFIKSGINIFEDKHDYIILLASFGPSVLRHKGA